MSARCLVVEARAEHAEALAGRLRTADVREIQASYGGEPDAALRRSWATSELRWAGLVSGRVVCLFGAARPSTLSTWGVPWMLGSAELDLRAVGLEVGRRTGQYVREMRRRFDFLQNWVDARQRRSIRWLQWGGFHVEPPEPWGVEGRPFHRFWMRGGDHV